MLLHIILCTLRGSLRLLSFGQVGASLYALLAHMPCCLWNNCSGSYSFDNAVPTNEGTLSS